MTHLWIRAEPRQNERRVPVLPDGVAKLIAAGFHVTVEDSADRIIPTADYHGTGADIAPEGSWPVAPTDAIIVGLKELPADGTPLPHRHIMFGHAYKGQADGPELLRRFAAGGGTLLDLEYLTDPSGRRVAAFGYWAGYAGAAVTLLAWAAQQRGTQCPAVTEWESGPEMLADLQTTLSAQGAARPTALIVGAKGRVGTGAADLCTAMGVPVTGWDMEETAHGGPFPEILAHDLFFNCVLAGPSTPRFVGPDDIRQRLSVIGDIACDPTSEFNPVPLYSEATTWETPVIRVADGPPLDIMAIDNLPSLLPLESSEDFAEQLLPHLLTLPDGDIWHRASGHFDDHAGRI